MKAPTKLAFLICALSLISCNEQVSSELQKANSAGGTIPDAIVPGEFTFKLTNTASVLLNYKLHKTGAGNSGANCEIKKNVPLTNALFVSGDQDSDITCFLDSEELSLYFNGLSLAIEASPNTCEYVSYSPYSFYDYKPGSSSTTVTKVTCANADTNDSHASGQGSPMTGNGRAVCNSYVDTSITPATDRDYFYLESDNDLCRFNYEKEGGPNCDTGMVTINEMIVTHQKADAENDAVTKTEWQSRKLYCGGSPANCVAGAIKLEEDADAKESTFYTWIQPSTYNESYSKKVEYKGMIERGVSSNIELVNYRRDLASPNIDFIETEDLDYPSKFINIKSYQPALMDRYSVNRRMDAITPIINNAAITTASYVMKDTLKVQKATPHAAEPFMGLTYRVNPFYSFHCLDTAMDVKARIRLVVRDWDRIFPGDQGKLELISDLFDAANARQDAPNYTELPWDFGHFNKYNDRNDWDDIIYMTRTPGPLDLLVPSSTIWEPKLGFFNDELFPRQILNEN